MTTPDLLQAIGPVVDALDRLGIDSSVVGSVASSAHGVARATIDIDLVVDLPDARVDAFVDALIGDYYVDRDAAHDAVARSSMFNLVHLATMLKVDVYVLTTRAFDRASFARRRAMQLDASPDSRAFDVDSPEDTVLHKLEWYRAGGEVSDRQWGDLVGVLRVQRAALDREYLRQWAATLQVSDLLDRAFADAAID